MSEEDGVATKKKGGKMGLILGMILMIGLGGAGFYVVQSGMIALPIPSPGEGDSHGAQVASLDHGAEPATAFVPMTPLLVAVGGAREPRHLQFSADLEVAPGKVETVTLLMPRIVDVLNTYLRAIDPADVENPASMLRIRAQMLRRVQVVTGEGVVRDLLVAEFVMR
jgi:flagellar FliL protein